MICMNRLILCTLAVFAFAATVIYFDEVKVSDLDTSQAEGQALQGYLMAMPGVKTTTG